MAPPRPRLTHFLSIPLHTPTALPTLESTLSTLTTHLTPLVPPGAIRPAITLHLTLGVMSLPTPAELQSALTLLSTLDLSALLHPPDQQPPAPPLTLRLRGLAAMGNNPARTSVLYAVPEDATGRLQGFAEAVRARFVAAGHVQAEERGLKLHATVVNTTYVSGGRRAVFDAREVLDWGRDLVFAEEVAVQRVCVCRMGEVRDGDGVSRGYLEVGRREFGRQEEERSDAEEGGVRV